MDTNPADTTADAVPATEVPQNDGSIGAATEALLKMLDAEEAQPSTEAEQPVEDQESQPEELEESESETDGGEYEDSEETEYEPDSNRSEEGDDDSDVYAVKVDGKEIEVSLNELIAGYSRQSDYTKKTQALSEERKSIESEKSQYLKSIEEMAAVRQQYQSAIGQFLEQAHGNLSEFADIDWKRLKEDDPLEYVTKRDEFRDAQARIQQAERLRQQSVREQEEQNQALIKQHVAEEMKLMTEKMPEWGDSEKRGKLVTDIRNYAESVGFQEEEINNLIDHRSLQVLIKAMKYDALEGGNIAKKKLKNKPKLIRPGNSRTQEADDRKRKAAKFNRLKESGSAKDAAALIEDLM